MRDEPLSLNERTFILEALRDGKRVDGRRAYDLRSVYATFGEQLGQVEVQMGTSRVMSVITAEIVAPRSERGTEGLFQFQTEFSPMACIEFGQERRNTAQVELGRIVERGLRESRAIDTEALCIVAGRKVWCIRCHIHVLDHGGNLIDCASLATILGLLHFRRPDVTVVGEDVTVHSLKERLPVPLSIHHIPISITFAIFDEGEIIICDPTYKEEQAMESRMSMTLNAQEEICAVQKAGGSPLEVEQILECTRIAVVKVQALDRWIKDQLALDTERRKAQQPTAVGYTPHVPKQAQWEALYQQEQPTPSTPTSQKDTKKNVTSHVPTNQATTIKQEAQDDEDEPMTESVVAETAPPHEEKKSLFSGGQSAWDDEDAVTSPTPDVKMSEDSDSEEEETITLSTTETAPTPSSSSSKTTPIPTTVAKSPAPTDLSAALKSKPKRKKGRKSK